MKIYLSYYYDFELWCHLGAQKVHFPPNNNNNNNINNNNWDHYLTWRLSPQVKKSVFLLSFEIVWKITLFVFGISDCVTLLHLTAELLLVEEESLAQVDVAIVEDDHRDKEEGDKLPPAKVANVAGEHRVVGTLKRNARKSTQKRKCSYLPFPRRVNSSMSSGDFVCLLRPCHFWTISFPPVWTTLIRMLGMNQSLVLWASDLRLCGVHNRTKANRTSDCGIIFEQNCFISSPSIPITYPILDSQLRNRLMCSTV